MVPISSTGPVPCEHGSRGLAADCTPLPRPTPRSKRQMRRFSHDYSNETKCVNSSEKAGRCPEKPDAPLNVHTCALPWTTPMSDTPA